MKITFDTNIKEEVAEVLALLAPESKVTVPTEAKEEKTIAKPTPKPKTAPEPKKAAPKKGIELGDLKESAKNAVGRTNRDAVKEAISEFADKLANVSEEDYGKLYKKLQELGA